MFATLIIAIVMAVSINIVATYLIVPANDLERSQKIIQALIVWLLPVLGAILVIAMRREFSSRHKPRSPALETGDDSGIDLALSVRRGVRRQEDELDPD